MNEIKQVSGVPQCAVDYAFQRIGGKHKGRIIWNLSGGVLRYGELRRVITGITPKMLSQTLRELEEDELIVRRAYTELPPRVEYELSENGRQLLPFIEMLSSWAKEQMAGKGIPYLIKKQAFEGHERDEFLL